MDTVDCIVAGAGVIGLAIAREISKLGVETIVVEAADAIGTETSSRNSEVIHAGIYYPQGSLKAQLCVSGRDKLYDDARERSIPHKRCGKLIVATRAEQNAALASIVERARASRRRRPRHAGRRQSAGDGAVAALHVGDTVAVNRHHR